MRALLLLLRANAIAIHERQLSLHAWECVSFNFSLAVHLCLHTLSFSSFLLVLFVRQRTRSALRASALAPDSASPPSRTEVSACALLHRARAHSSVSRFVAVFLPVCMCTVSVVCACTHLRMLACKVVHESI